MPAQLTQVTYSHNVAPIVGEPSCNVMCCQFKISQSGARFDVCREAIAKLVGVGAVVHKPYHVQRGLKKCFFIFCRAALMQRAFEAFVKTSPWSSLSRLARTDAQRPST